MRLLFSLLLVAVLSACGGYTRVGFFFYPGPSSVNGTVSIVHVTVIGGNGGASVTITAVTLIGNGTANDVNFCGDHRDQFPMDTTVTATFTPGTNCNTIISVH